MNPTLSTLPFRLGTTSYIIPADILPNAQFLAGKIKDIELVLFEVDDAQNNLPSSQVIEGLCQLAAAYDLTYTVHLPLDLRLGSDGSTQHESIIKARRAIQATRDLHPWAYVAHLDGREVIANPSSQALQHWQDQAVCALETISASLDNRPDLLAVENLDHYPPDFWNSVLECVPVSRCTDIGHLWLEKVDPLPYLAQWLPRTRVIHLHGIHERDHSSLQWVPLADLDRVMQVLVDQYRGVATLEIFGEEDFTTSCSAIEDSLKRIKENS